jgi:hypothetical protein
MYKVDFGNKGVWYDMVDKPYVPSVKSLPLVLLISDKESLDGVDIAAKTNELTIKWFDDDTYSIPAAKTTDKMYAYEQSFKDLEYASLTSMACSGFFEVKYNQEI